MQADYYGANKCLLTVLCVGALMVSACGPQSPGSGEDHQHRGQLYDLNTGLDTRSISFENQTGERGVGGQAASPLGVGRKGAPARALQPGEEVVLADITGNGAEDYVGLSWGLQPTPFLYHGSTYRETGDPSETGRVSMYRWHIKDPVLWETRGRATIQQIGHTPGPTAPTTVEEYLANLFEREDDWSAASFWYESVPSAPLPAMPDFAARTADLANPTGQ